MVMEIMPNICEMNALSIEIPENWVRITLCFFYHTDAKYFTSLLILLQMIDRSIPPPVFNRSIISDILRGREIVKITRMCPLLTSADLQHIIQVSIFYHFLLGL